MIDKIKTVQETAELIYSAQEVEAAIAKMAASFRYTISSGGSGCTSTKDVSISYGTAPTITLTTPSPSMLDCGASQASISYSQTGTGTISYSILTGPATSTFTPPTAWANVVAQPALLPGFTVPGTYVIRFRKVEGAGSACNTDYKDITVIVSKSPTGSNSGSSQFLGCNIIQTELAGNLPTVGTGKWTQVSGPNTAVFANTDIFNSHISSLVNGAYTFRWLISGGPACSTQQSDVIVRVATVAPTVADAGPDQTLICYGSPTSMAGNLPVLNETGTWTVSPSSGVTFSDNHNRFAVVNGLQASTTYTFTWTIFNGCSSSSNTCVVTTTSTHGPVQAVAGIDQCKSAGTTSITLAGNTPAPSGATGLWTKESGGAAIITDATSPTTTVTGMSDGTYTFLWTLSYGTCIVSSDAMTVTISAAASTANAGPDQSICGTAVTLAGNTASVGTGSWSQISGGGGITITDTAAYNTTVTSLSDGVYGFRWTVYNNACPSSSNDVQINVSVPPTTALAGIDQSICNGTTATMAGNTPGSGTGFWSLISGPNTPTITNSALATTTLSGLTTGYYTFGWNIYSGPFCPTSSDVMNIQVVPAANAGSAQTLCNATTTTLTGNISTGGTWSYISGPTTPSNLPATGSNVVEVAGLVPGVYVFQ
ncbi:MAG: hypothetical protein WCK63_18010, partial [Betaproteobacteria bacterium]